MQLLWDQHKKGDLTCARVKDLPREQDRIVKDVIQLYQAHEKTVLLLADNVQIMEDNQNKSLKDSLIDEIRARCIGSKTPVVIILVCDREGLSEQREQNSLEITAQLSPDEQKQFEVKYEDCARRFNETHANFHGLKIMRDNFDPRAVQEIFRVLKPLTKERPRQVQLFAILALVNSFVPGSYLLQEQCLAFLGTSENEFLEKMGPFSHLCIVFATEQERKCVRLAHQMIANECVKWLTASGITLGDTTQNFLGNFFSDQESQSTYLPIAKKMLTKRATIWNNTQKHVRKHRFSKLIQHIERGESSDVCVRVLKEASDRFDVNPFFPQALARFYDLQVKNYDLAVYWANIAIKRHDNNSFVMDTLGQVYKHQLHNSRATVEDVLRVGNLAIKAFRDETKAAKNEDVVSESRNNGLKNAYAKFNFRGIYGSLEVASKMFYHLESLDENWCDVLVLETPVHASPLSRSLKEEHRQLIGNLRHDVETNFEFLEWFLTYSKPNVWTTDPPDIRDNATKIYKMFLGRNAAETPEHTLKNYTAYSFPGINWKIKDHNELSLIRNLWMKIHSEDPLDANNAQNYVLSEILLNHAGEPTASIQDLQRILAEIMMKGNSQSSPEFYLLVLSLFWPEEHQSGALKINLDDMVERMRQSYDVKYKKFLRSRYLVPIFYIGSGRGFQKLIHCWKFTIDELGDVPRRFSGTVQNFKVFVCIADKKIQVSPDLKASVMTDGPVTFDLGFNIRGPVAYNIKY
uniref:Uncharacterized protein n=2 Tax=Denticeps clupeoides TaxID=299321 RepID=A0AAY4DHA0_9TELE